MNKYKIEIKWAFIFIATTLLWMCMEKLTGLHDVNIDKHPIVSMLFFIPAVTVYVLALLNKKKKFYHGTMTYKEGFICGLIITVIVTIFSPLTQYLTAQVISPDYFANAIEYSVANEKATRAEAEDFFNLKSYIQQVVMMTPIMGIATTAIVAIFTKSRKTN